MRVSRETTLNRKKNIFQDIFKQKNNKKSLKKNLASSDVRPRQMTSYDASYDGI
jgi:hypothetical protein